MCEYNWIPDLIWSCKFQRIKFNAGFFKNIRCPSVHGVPENPLDLWKNENKYDSGHFICSKEIIYGTPENITICPKIGVLGVTKTSEVCIVKRIAQTRGA